MKLAASKVDFLVEGVGITVTFCAPGVTTVVTAGMVGTAGEGLAVELVGDGLAVGPTTQLLELLTTVQFGVAACSEQ